MNVDNTVFVSLFLTICPFQYTIYHKKLYGCSFNMMGTYIHKKHIQKVFE